MNAEPGSLGRALRILRLARRVTLNSIEQATGIWRPTILKYEKGQQKLPYLAEARIVRAMGLPMEAVQLAQSFDLDLDAVMLEAQGVQE